MKTSAVTRRHAGCFSMLVLYVLFGCFFTVHKAANQPWSGYQRVPGRLLQLFVLMLLLHIVQKHNNTTRNPSFTPPAHSRPSGTARRSRASAGHPDIFYMISSKGLKSSPSAIRGRRLVAEALTESKEWFNQEAAFYLDILHPLRCNRRKKIYFTSHMKNNSFH